MALAAAAEHRAFFIISEKNGLVMDVHKADAKPGAQVVVNKKREGREPHQLWYVDELGILRSKLNTFAMEALDNKDKVHMKPYTGDARQQWVVQGNKIVNKMFCNECLELKHTIRKEKENADIIATPYAGKPDQHWKIEYIM